MNKNDKLVLDRDELFRNTLRKYLQVSDKVLNSSIIDYSGKILALKKLIENHEVSSEVISKLNHSLFEALKIIRATGDGIKIPFEIRPLTQSETNDIISDLNEALDQCDQNESENDFLKIFEDAVVAIFFRENTDGDYEEDKNSLIQLQPHKNKDGGVFSRQDVGFDELTEHYLFNFSKIIGNKNKKLSWPKQLLINYLKFAENQVFSISSDFVEKVRELVKRDYCKELVYYQSKERSPEKIEGMRESMTSTINELNGNTSSFLPLIEVQKLHLTLESESLFEKINEECFPSAVHDYLEKSKIKDELFYSDFLKRISKLNETRLSLEKELETDGLKYFSRFESIDPILSDFISDSYKSVEVFKKILTRQNCPLHDFMNQRHAHSGKIESLIDNDSGEYKKVIDEIGNYKNVISSSKNNILIALYSSLDDLALDLKNKFIGTLKQQWVVFVKTNQFTERVQTQCWNELNQNEADMNVKAQKEIQKEYNIIINKLASAKYDNFYSSLNDDVIKAEVKHWVANRKFSKNHIWIKPKISEIEMLIIQLFTEKSKDFIDRQLMKTKTIMSKNDSFEFQSENIIGSFTKILNISVDSLKAFALAQIAPVFATLVVLNTDHVKMCTNDINSIIDELKDELSLKEIENHKKEIIESLTDNGELFLEVIEKYKKNPSSVFKKIGAKLSDRYNVFDNSNAIESVLTQKIISIRDKLNQDLDEEIKKSITDKLKIIS